MADDAITTQWVDDHHVCFEAEHQCRPDQLQYTPEYIIAAQQFQFFKILLRQRQKGKLNMRFLVRKMRQANVQIDDRLNTLSLEYIQEACDAAKAHFNAVKRKQKQANKLPP